MDLNADALILQEINNTEKPERQNAPLATLTRSSSLICNLRKPKSYRTKRSTKTRLDVVNTTASLVHAT